MNEFFNQLGAWPHILQSHAWAEFKARWGWKILTTGPRSHHGGEDTVSILARQIKVLPFPILYVPKGPNVNWHDRQVRTQTLAQLENWARAQHAIFIKIDPDVSIEQAAVSDELQRRGWQFSADQIQYRNTLLLDLRPSEQALFAALKPKWRYNIRLAERRGVSIQSFDSIQCKNENINAHLQKFYALYAETAARDHFLIRPFAYYQDVWSDFLRKGLAALLLAYHAEKLIAGLLLFICQKRAWYFYGASASTQRELMPNHLLQWRAIQVAKSCGCEVYDFWGAPDQLIESEPMWGVYRFKEGFGAALFQGIGAWDFAPSRVRYQLYTQTMPKVIALMRRRHNPQDIQ